LARLLAIGGRCRQGRGQAAQSGSPEHRVIGPLGELDRLTQQLQPPKLGQTAFARQQRRQRRDDLVLLVGSADERQLVDYLLEKFGRLLGMVVRAFTVHFEELAGNRQQRVDRARACLAEGAETGERAFALALRRPRHVDLVGKAQHQLASGLARDDQAQDARVIGRRQRQQRLGDTLDIGDQRGPGVEDRPLRRQPLARKEPCQLVEVAGFGEVRAETGQRIGAAVLRPAPAVFEHAAAVVVDLADSPRIGDVLPQARMREAVAAGAVPSHQATYAAQYLLEEIAGPVVAQAGVDRFEIAARDRPKRRRKRAEQIAQRGVAGELDDLFPPAIQVGIQPPGLVGDLLRRDFGGGNVFGQEADVERVGAQAGSVRIGCPVNDLFEQHRIAGDACAGRPQSGEQLPDVIAIEAAERQRRDLVGRECVVAAPVLADIA